MRRIVITTALALASTAVGLAAPASAESRYTVTASVSATSVDVGQTFTVKGKVSPLARGEWAIVQRKVGSSWTKVARDAINRYGNYRATVTVTEPGDNEYRVLKRHSRGHLRGVSATFTVTGWRWRALHTMPTSGPINNVAYLASSTLGTTDYPITYSPLIKVGGPGGSATYVLAQKCTKFEGDVGVTPDSAADTFQTAILGTLAAEGASAVQVLGQSVRRNQDPAHVARSGAVISQAWGLNVYADATAGTFIGWGNAKVYCKS
jgi:hypothetical protein